MRKGFQAIRFSVVGICLVSIVTVMAGCTEALMPIAAVEHGNATAVQMAGAENGAAASPAVGAAALSDGAVSLDVKADKVDVCHRTGDGSFQRISVSAKALPAHLAHGDLVVGVDADENCEPLGGGSNIPPVALDGPLVNGVAWVPGDSDQPPAEDGDLNLLASDENVGDILTFSLVPGTLNPEGNDVLSFEFNTTTGVWSAFCIGVTSGYSSFQWIANDGQADSNIATQYFLCLI